MTNEYAHLCCQKCSGPVEQRTEKDRLTKMYKNFWYCVGKCNGICEPAKNYDFHSRKFQATLKDVIDENKGPMFGIDPGTYGKWRKEYFK